MPIGLILRYNSGTPIQAWIPKDDSEVIRKRLGIPEGWNDVQENRNPGVQFADKIDPIVPVCFRGVIWYQGERNAKAQTGYEYRQLLPFMIENWRQLFASRGGITRPKVPFLLRPGSNSGCDGRVAVAARLHATRTCDDAKHWDGGLLRSRPQPAPS